MSTRTVHPNSTLVLHSVGSENVPFVTATAYVTPASSGGTVQSVTTPHAPLYIPGEICGTLGVDPATKPDDCLSVVQHQVTAGNISAPPSVAPALLELVDQAHDHGIDLKIVVLDHNPPNDTPLRDIATVVGA